MLARAIEEETIFVFEFFKIIVVAVLPFLAARLNTTSAALFAQPRAFGEHAILFLQEVADQPARAHSMTAAEIKAWSEIKKAAALAGIHG